VHGALDCCECLEFPQEVACHTQEHLEGQRDTDWLPHDHTLLFLHHGHLLFLSVTSNVDAIAKGAAGAICVPSEQVQPLASDVHI